MIKNIFTATFVVILLTGCNNNHNTKEISFYTSMGSFNLVLYPDNAPLTVSNFMYYVENKEFDNKSFYRSVKSENQPDNKIKIEVIQGGVGFFESEANQNTIPHESTNHSGLKHLDGTISMARADTGTATTEFFICIGEQPALDFGGLRNPDKQGFAAFGKVISGMDIVRDIHKQADTNQFFVTPVVIDSIRVIK